MMTMTAIMMMHQSGDGAATAAPRRQLIRATSLLAAVVLLVLASCCQLPTQVECQEQLTVESRQQKDNDDLTDTIKYLEKLDKYFSQIARPRFGRSEYKQPHRLQPGWPLAGARLAAPSPFLATAAAPTGNNLLSEQLTGAELLELAAGNRLY